MPSLETKKVSWFLGFQVFGFLVSWFLGCLVSWFFVSWFLGFLVSWFQRFLVSWFQNFNDSVMPYDQTSISCFLIDIDLISKIFRICYLDLHHFPVPVFSKIDKFVEFQFLIFIQHILKIIQWVFLVSFRYPGVSKKKIVSARKCPFKKPEIIEINSLMLSHKQIGKL